MDRRRREHIAVCPGERLAGALASERYVGIGTIVQTSDGSYRRLLSGGDTVVFDAQGRHVCTVSGVATAPSIPGREVH